MTAMDLHYTGQRNGKIAVIAGSGLEGIGDSFQVNDTTVFDEIDGLGACTVTGHAGKVLVCESGAREFFLVLGRRHVYEGGRYGMGWLIQWLARRGAGGLVVVSAAGGLRKSYPPGELVSVDGIIDLQNFPLLQRETWPVPRPQKDTGRVELAAAERGLGCPHAAPSPGLTAAVREAAVLAGVPLGRGTLACCAGPAYETPAEVVYLKRVGADLATMSSAPEVLFACRTGLEVAVIGAVTNYATRIGTAPVEHAGVLEKAGAMCEPLSRIIAELIEIG
jgi:purine-nucleoside phosphorylase